MVWSLGGFQGLKRGPNYFQNTEGQLRKEEKFFQVGGTGCQEERSWRRCKRDPLKQPNISVALVLISWHGW